MLKPLLLLPVVLILGYHPSLLSAATLQENSSTTAAQSKNGGKASADVPPRVKKIYEIDCALCHGASGNGKTDLATDMKLTLTDLTDPNTLAAKTDQQLFDLIRKGNGQMPPEDESRAKNDEVKSLILYLRSLSKGQPAQPPPAAATPAPAAPSTN